MSEPSAAASNGQEYSEADVLPPENAPVPDSPGDNTGDAAAPADPLSQALLEAAQWKEVALRTAAELDNYRKRMARELQDAVKYGNAGLLETLLPVLDNFEYGLQAAKAESEGSTLFTGFSMVLRQIQDFLKDQGVEEVDGLGQAFNPNLHDAVSQQPSATAPEGIVIQQMRKGYKLRDRLLRPASVIVSGGPPAAETEAG